MIKKDIKTLLDYNCNLCIKKLNKIDCDCNYNYEIIYNLLDCLRSTLIDKGVKAYKDALKRLNLNQFKDYKNRYYFLTYNQQFYTKLFIDKLKQVTL